MKNMKYIKFYILIIIFFIMTIYSFIPTMKSNNFYEMNINYIADKYMEEQKNEEIISKYYILTNEDDKLIPIKIQSENFIDFDELYEKSLEISIRDYQNSKLENIKINVEKVQLEAKMNDYYLDYLKKNGFTDKEIEKISVDYMLVTEEYKSKKSIFGLGVIGMTFSGLFLGISIKKSKF